MMYRKVGRKADLHLSINAIVVLILAITMLGLGLGFMRNIFGGAIEEFQEVRGTVQKQMVDQMKETNKIVDLSRNKVDIKAGEKKQIYIGFKNDERNPKEFKVLDPNTRESCTPLTPTNDCENIHVKYKPEQEVPSGKVVVVPLNIETDPSIVADTYFFEIRINTGGGNVYDEVLELTVDVKV